MLPFVPKLVRKSNSLYSLTLCSVLAQAGAPPIFPPVAVSLSDGGHGRQQHQHPQLHVLEQNGQFPFLALCLTDDWASLARELTESEIDRKKTPKNPSNIWQSGRQQKAGLPSHPTDPKIVRVCWDCALTCLIPVTLGCSCKQDGATRGSLLGKYKFSSILKHCTLIENIYIYIPKKPKNHKNCTQSRTFSLFHLREFVRCCWYCRRRSDAFRELSVKMDVWCYTPPDSYFPSNCRPINHLLPQPERLLINAASSCSESPPRSGNEPLVNQSSQRRRVPGCPPSMLQWGWRWDGQDEGGRRWRRCCFSLSLITPLPLSYFSLLSVIALAWNVVRGAFTRSISHAEAGHSRWHAAATDNG